MNHNECHIIAIWKRREPWMFHDDMTIGEAYSVASYLEDRYQKEMSIFI